jgi:ribose/xylose/arabinose/galactoside ABC-type transport system permease subunit
LVPLALVVAAALVSPVFLSTRSSRVVFKQAAPLGSLLVGKAVVLLIGGIDLSVSWVMSPASIAAAGISNGSSQHI